MTFSEMQTDVLDILQDWQNHPDYTVTKLKHYINLGNRAFARLTKAIEGTIDITTVSNLFEYTQSNQANLQYLFKPKQVRYIEASSEIGRKLSPYPAGYTNLPKDKQYGTPYFYWFKNIAGRSIESGSTGAITRQGVSMGTWPIAGTASKTLRVEGFLWPATMTDDAHVPEYDEAWHDAPVYWAAFRLLWLFSEKTSATRQKMADCKNMFDQRVIEANSELAINQFDLMGTPDMMTDMESW